MINYLEGQDNCPSLCAYFLQAHLMNRFFYFLVNTTLKTILLKSFFLGKNKRIKPEAESFDDTHISD